MQHDLTSGQPGLKQFTLYKRLSAAHSLNLGGACSVT